MVPLAGLGGTRPGSSLGHAPFPLLVSPRAGHAGPGLELADQVLEGVSSKHGVRSQPRPAAGPARPLAVSRTRDHSRADPRGSATQRAWPARCDPDPGLPPIGAGTADRLPFPGPR